jgi:hypothetical protein
MVTVPDPPFSAYVGADPYIFASYAHREGAVVFEDLAELHERGYRIWYDQGIDPGNEWPDEIAEALSRSSQLLVFLSEAAASSRNVRSEIAFALNRNKSVVVVHLEHFVLPAPLELRLGDAQAILRQGVARDLYFDQLERGLGDEAREPLLGRVDRIRESYRAHVRVIDSVTGKPLRRAQITIDYVAEEGDGVTSLRQRKHREPLLTATADAKGAVYFGILPRRLMGPADRFEVTARALGFDPMQATLAYEGPTALMALPADSEVVLNLHSRECRGFAFDESLVLSLVPTTPAVARPS